MPNHVTNILNFVGPEEDIYRLIAHVRSLESLFDFNQILPMPTELRGTTSPPRPPGKKEDESDEEYSDRYSNWEERQKYLHETYGAVDWYEWANRNWGTKWNAYEITITDREITFDTAWETPIPVITALSMVFPSVVIDLKYADEDIGRNCGHLKIQNGEVDNFWIPNYYSPEAKTFALKVKGWEIDNENF